MLFSRATRQIRKWEKITVRRPPQQLPAHASHAVRFCCRKASRGVQRSASGIPVDPSAPQHQDAFVDRLRKSETRTLVHAGQLVQRSAGEIVRAALLKHETFSPFLAPVTPMSPRWQLVVIVVTVIFAFLVVDVWFYWSKAREDTPPPCCAARRHASYSGGPALSPACPAIPLPPPPSPAPLQAVNCCTEVRQLLSCSLVTTEECMGFSGDCSALPDQFREFLPSDYECKQFPCAPAPAMRGAALPCALQPPGAGALLPSGA